MLRILPLLLLLATPLMASPGKDSSDSSKSSDSSPSDERHRRSPLVLQDAAEWSASMEVQDKIRPWVERRRRSLEDLEAAESVVFMPAHLREKKKVAMQVCRKMHSDRKAWKRSHPLTPEKISWQCNPYCCYPIVL